MRKKTTVLLFMLLLPLSIWAQDTIRHIIISEVRFDGWENCYVELTNMGDSAVNLSNFYYGNVRGSADWMLVGDEVVYTGTPEALETDTKMMRCSGILEPGESTLAMMVYDEIQVPFDWSKNPPGNAKHTLGHIQYATMFNHGSDGGGDPLTKIWPYLPEYEMWGKDSSDASTNYSLALNHRPNNESAALFWVSGDTIAVLVDQAMLDIDWNTSSRRSGFIKVAGVEEAADNYNLVRKFIVKEGETNWTNAVGVDGATSQWMLYPHVDGRGLIKRETEGNHDDYHIDVSSDVFTFGEGTVTVPWGTQKGDAIRPNMTLGKGMSWWYLENDNFEDSLSNVCKNADTLVLYAFGNDIEMEKYVITVSDPAADMVDVVARHAISYPDPESEDYTPDQIPLVGGVPYRILSGLSEMDTIADVPYATKVDSLFKLIEKAPSANWEIVFSSGEVNNEVAFGDILRVTGGDGTTTKDYFIKTDDYMPSDNLNLASITWPDKTFAFREGWKGDTIPGFVTTGVSYKVSLPVGTKAVPALLAVTEDLNAKLSVQRAASLAGGIAERTTTFVVTSESDTLTREITVLFEVDNPYAQLYFGDVFFSKIFTRWYWNAAMTEICNPSDDLLDLSQYMIVKSDLTSPAEAIASISGNDSTTWLNRYQKYVPGFKWQTYDNWLAEPGILELDNAVVPVMEAGDVFVLWKSHPKRKGNIQEVMEERGDVLITDDEDLPGGGVYANPWNEPLALYNTVAYPLVPDANMYLFKILNDSVRQGKKPATDPMDFDLVDAFGSTVDPWMCDGQEVTTGTRRIVRKPEIYKGVSNLGDGMDDQWTYEAVGKNDRNPFLLVIGQHTFNPVTEQISTVSSLIYLVDKGFEGEIGIKGVSNSETVADFLMNLIPGDTAQDLTVTSPDGTPRAEGDAVVEGDKLVVVSANEVNTTTYTISLVPQDDNATLTAVDGSGLLIEISGETGSVGGFSFGMSIKEVLENVNVPELALLNVVDENDELVPLTRLNIDTVYVDITATSANYFEVIAEAGNKIVYQLMPDASASDAYVLSDLYTVYEEPVKIINQVVQGTAVDAFIGNLIPVSGATLKIMTITGQERTLGNLSIDDVLEVSSSDATVMVRYEINFLDELSAYVTSDVFTIDQETMSIEVPDNTSVEAMLAGLAPAPSAVMMVKDADGNEKASGTVLETDMLEVTSGDGRVTSTYSISVLVSVYNDLSDRLHVYPNPAQSILYVENIPMDTYVRISDITGRTLSLSQAFDVASGINLSDMRSGIYFLTIEKDGKKQATVKFVKK